MKEGWDPPQACSAELETGERREVFYWRLGFLGKKKKRFFDSSIIETMNFCNHISLFFFN
jgi:hypothetical protein